MPRIKPERMIRIAVVTGGLLLAVVLNLLYLRPILKASTVDFSQFYIAGQLVARGKVAQIYDVAAYAPLVAAAGLRHGTTYFNRPAFAAVLCRPLAWFPYQTSCNIIIGFNFLLWGLLVWKLPVWLGAPAHLRVWLLSFFPFLWSTALGQDTLAITFAVAYACCALMRRNETAAGVLLGFCLVKPHLIILLPLLLLIERRRRALISFLVTGCALGAISFALIGVHGVQQWLALLHTPMTDYSPGSMGNIRALELHFGMPVALAAGALTIAAGVVVMVRGNYLDRLSVSILLSLLLSPHTYWQDYSLASILALSAPDPLTRYMLLLPWCYFWPTLDMWPMVFVSLGCLLLMAARTLRARKPAPNSGAFGVDAGHCLPEFTVPLARWRSKLPLSEVVCNSFCLVRRLLHQGRIART